MMLPKAVLSSGAGFRP